MIALRSLVKIVGIEWMRTCSGVGPIADVDPTPAWRGSRYTLRHARLSRASPARGARVILAPELVRTKVTIRSPLKDERGSSQATCISGKGHV